MHCKVNSLFLYNNWPEKHSRIPFFFVIFQQGNFFPYHLHPILTIIVVTHFTALKLYTNHVGFVQIPDPDLPLDPQDYSI
jgi:hypothetical protein